MAAASAPHAQDMRIRIAEATLSVRCNDDSVAGDLGRRWASFATFATPDLILSIALQHTMTRRQAVSAYAQARHQWKGNRLLCEGPQVWDAELDWDNRTFTLQMEAALLDPTVRPRLLNQMMLPLYNTACDLRGDHTARLVHGCGVVVDGQGYLFIGPSGAGKSTVASLAGTRRVLNDETVALRAEPGGFRIAGTPFLGDIECPTSGWHPLHAVLMLRQSLVVGLQPLSAGEAFGRFLPQVLSTRPINAPQLPVRPESRIADRADLAAAAVRALPMYELCFRRDDTFWPLVESL
ncbi:MAG: phosphoenolpyruvate carboxykinase (ATP) [Anaerolineae bacterium]